MKKEFYKKIGLYLHRIRVARGLSSRFVAHGLGIDVTVLSDFENGNKPIDLYTFYIYCNILNLPTEQVLQLNYDQLITDRLNTWCKV